MTDDVLTFLKGIRKKRRELRIIQDRIGQLRMSLYPSGIRYDIDRVQTSPTDRMVEVAAQLDEIERKEREHVRQILSDNDKAETLVSLMPTSEYRQLIYLRYLASDESSSWESVANAMHYSSDHVRGRMHGAAIAEAREIWGKMDTTP